MAWLFLGVVLALIALVKLDSYVHELELATYPFGFPPKARQLLFKKYAKRIWAWYKRLWKFVIQVIFKISLFGFLFSVFVAFIFIFVIFFGLYFFSFINTLYTAVDQQIKDIKVNSYGFRNVSLSIAGSMTLLIAVLGVILTLIRNLLTRQQNNTDEQRLVTEQISRAVDQIGAYKQTASGAMLEPNIEVRLGGLYSLQRIMQDSPRDEETIAKIFYAYVRENAKRDKIKIEIIDTPPREDVQTALDIIKKFNEEWGEQGKNISDDSRINFSRTCLKAYSLKDIDFSYAILESIDLASLQLVETNFYYSNLSGADLSGAELIDINLSNANLFCANLSGANLYNSNLIGVVLAHAILSNTGLYDVDFASADLSSINLSGAVVYRTSFHASAVYNANLSGADLSHSDLSYANLSGANLSGANLSSSNLSYVNLSRANLSGADLSTAENLIQEQIDKAKGDKKTKLPEDLKRPDSWKKKPTTKKIKKEKNPLTKS